MQRIQTPEMQGLGLPFCSAVRVGDMLYMSGVLGNLPGGLTLAPGGLVAEGLALRDAVQSAVVEVLSDDDDVIRALGELADAVLPRP